MLTPANHCRRKAGCPICKESKGERKIRFCLEKLKINFKTQHKFNDCKNKKLLPFDFILWLENKILLIEYQGEQHFKPMGFGSKNPELALEKLKRTQFTDKIKFDYCVKNNIPLLLIPYTEYDNVELILENFFKEQSV